MNILWLAVWRGRKPLLFAVALLALLGAWAYATAPRSIFPQVSFSRIEIFLWAGNLPPEQMRANVTRPLEAALGVLPALETRSRTNQGTVEIELDFDPASDPRADLQSVQAIVAAARPSLREVNRIETVIQHPSMEPVVSYALTAPSLSQARLRLLVEQNVAAAFAGLPGVGRMTVFAGPGVEYRVTLDPAALASAGSTVGDVTGAIADAGAAHAAGTIDSGDQRSVVFVGEALSDAAALGDVAVPDRRTNADVPLRTLGQVALGEGPAVQQASFDAKHAVLLSAYPVIGGDAVSVQRGLESGMAKLVAALPADVQVTRYWDQTRLIAASQNSLREAGLIGALLALVVIYGFLRSVRTTLVAAAMIPVALAITILIIQRAGLSLSMMSLGGLAIAVGLIIDEVIVVIEAIARELAGDESATPHLAIQRATGRIARALIGSTAANVVVFLPLVLLSGIPGFFFRAMAITIGVALVVSILLSLVVAPLLTDLLWRPGRQQAGLPTLEPWYERLLGWALCHRATVYLAALVVMGATAALFVRLESDFLPELEEGQFEIIYTLPAGTSLAATDRIVTGFERIIVADPAVEHEGRLTGVDTDGYEPTSQNAGTIRISLRADAADDYEDVADRLREAMSQAAPGASFEFHQLLEDQLNDLSGATEPIQIEVTGPDQATLIGIADGVTDQISKIPGIVDAFDGVTESNQTIRVAPKASSALTVDELSDAFAAAVGGTIATALPEGQGTIPVRVGLAEPTSTDLLAELDVPTKDGLQKLGQVATIGAPERSSQVEERNGARRLLITAGIEDANLSAVIPQIQSIVAAVKLPPGYRLAIGGAYRQQQDSFREFAQVLGVALVLVFLVLLATFNSFRAPLVILATIPLSPIGVLLALWLTGTPINVASFMGLLLLVGIVVRNGILLIDGANRRRREGAGPADAILDAGTERLRPILMTTFAAIGALLPLALGLGTGSEMLRPLAIAVIGGLSTATAFTLVLIPVLYATVAGGPAAELAGRVRARIDAGAAQRAAGAFVLRAIAAGAVVLAVGLGVAYGLGAFSKPPAPGAAEGSPDDRAQD